MNSKLEEKIKKLDIKLKLANVSPSNVNLGKAQSLFSVFIIILLNSSILFASNPVEVVQANILFKKPNSTALWYKLIRKTISNERVDKAKSNLL